jgi:hypothetical protein
MLRYVTVLSWFLLLSSTVAICGCDGAQVSRPEETRSVHALSVLYGKYRGAHAGRAPRSRDDFLRFVVEHEKATLELFGITDANQLLNSPSGVGELVLVAGDEALADTDPIIAFEPQPIKGKRIVVRSYAGLETMEETAFQHEKPGK